MTIPPTPAAGWYPDAEVPGQQRYWDGSAWTSHTAPNAAPAPVATSDSNTWAAVAHLSALVGLVIGFGFFGPLVVYLVKRDDDPFVRQEAAEALNFNLSVAIYAVVGGFVTVILVLLLVGLLLLPLIILAALAWLVLVIMAGVKASRGEPFRYPVTIRFVK